MFSEMLGRCTFTATSSPVARKRPLYTCMAAAVGLAAHMAGEIQWGDGDFRHLYGPWFC